MNPSNQSDQINELVTALAKAQGEIGPAIKECTNPHFRSRYADLNSVWNACRNALSKHGLAVVQTMNNRDNALFLETMLAHSSGQWIRSSLPIVTQKNDAQGIGTAITYMRRYGLAAIVGVTPDEDDDGESAVGRGKNKAKSEDSEISKAQLDYLTKVLITCGPKYKDAVLDHLEKKHQVASLDQLSKDLFQTVLQAALDKRKELNQAQEEFAKKSSNEGAVANA